MDQFMNLFYKKMSVGLQMDSDAGREGRRRAQTLATEGSGQGSPRERAVSVVFEGRNITRTPWTDLSLLHAAVLLPSAWSHVHTLREAGTGNTTYLRLTSYDLGYIYYDYCRNPFHYPSFGLVLLLS